MTDFKGATKLYSIHYSRVVIILLSTGLYKSEFSTDSFETLFFCVSVSLAFNF